MPFVVDRSVLMAMMLGMAACPTDDQGASPSGGPSKTDEPETKTEEPEAKTDEPETKADEPEADPPKAALTQPIDTALQSVPASISTMYALTISEDRQELTIDPNRRPRPAMRSRSGPRGISARESKAGGKVITLEGGPFLHGEWIQASFRERAPADQLDALTKAGYDVDATRDLLVVDGENDPAPTLFAFSADAGKLGVVGVCSEVSILDFRERRPVAVRKPVLYLYPRTITQVTVGLTVDGELTATYPALTDGTWTVTASPRGELVDEATGRRHRYLFWEGTSAGFELDPTRAHCIPGSETATFLEGACERFALTDHECSDLITYWLPELEPSPYNVIEFVDEEVYGRYAELRVEPQPDTVIRPFMIFRRSEVPVEVGAPELPQRRRDGFTVIEWGGANLDTTTADGTRAR